MSVSYVAVTQLVDGQVMPQDFRSNMLERDEVWKLVDKTSCVQTGGLGKAEQSAEITFKDRTKLRSNIKAPRGVDPDLTNEEIVQKWRTLVKGVINDERRDRIEKLCLGLEDLTDVMELSNLLAGLTKNPIA